jgi:radical SAM superfamily enzyme YgiQ (UPF0313 family)
MNIKKKLLFILLPYFIEKSKFSETSCIAMPYGILSIATFIKQYANIKIFDCNLHTNYIEALSHEILDFNPSIIGISLMFDNSYRYLSTIIKTIKTHNSTTKILLGGTATTYSYKEIVNENPEIDAICFGDGELPLKNYILTSQFNIGWITSNCSTPKKLLLPNLDSVIDVDYSLININDYQNQPEENYSPFMGEEKNKVKFSCSTSRNCCYKCLFCANSLNPDKQIRYASIDTIINHIDSLVNKYHMTILTLIDDQILYNTKRAKELFKRLQPYNLRIKIIGGVTPLFIDEELVDLLWNAGSKSLTLALESGSKKVLKIMHKPVKLDQVRQLMKFLRKYNFFIRINLVIGIPGETDLDRQETIAYIREIQPDIISPKIASPIYGSKLRQECIEKGYIPNPKIDMGAFVMSEAVINTPEYSGKYIEEQILYMNWRTNFVENYRMNIKDFNSAKDYFEYVATKYPQEAFAWYYLNKAKEKLGEIQDWTKFNQCLQTNPEWAIRFKNLGVLI